MGMIIDTNIFQENQLPPASLSDEMTGLLNQLSSKKRKYWSKNA
jgi:hypothetical protein